MTDPIKEELLALTKALADGKKALREAINAEAEAKRVLALRTIDLRQARERLLEAQNAVRLFIGEPIDIPPRQVIGWDEVWCPNCHRTFIPSKPGGSDRA